MSMAQQSQYPSLERLGRKLYHKLYGKPLPRRWRILWVGFIKEDGVANKRLFGICNTNTKTIQLSWDLHSKKGKHWGFIKKSHAGPLDTLLHELLHARFPDLNHGKKFNQLLRESWKRLHEIQL